MHNILLLSIIEDIKSFAEGWYLNNWDWVAVSVALFSLCVACLSFVIAYKTLKSQRQTEKNTMPIINQSIQEFLLKQFIINLLDGQTRICALWNLLHDNGFSSYPSEQLIEKIKIHIDNIHSELFYNNHNHYLCINGLLNMSIEYNINLTVLNNHLSNPSISNDMLNQEFDNIVKQNQKIAKKWEKVMSLIYNYDKNKISSIFDNHLVKVENNNNKVKYYQEDDEAYLDFFEDADRKAQMLHFMDSRTIMFVSEYQFFLIKKINHYGN